MKNYFRTMVGLACVVIVGLVIVMKPSMSRGTIQKTSGKSASPTVLAESQSGSPLKITIINVNSTDALKPEVEYSMVNTGQKVIRAYAIRQDFTTDHSKFTATDCQVGRSINAFLQPGQATQGSISNSGSNEPITRITITVDVVEFDDGEFWGPNLTNSRDLIDGMHYGKKRAIDFYQQRRKQITLEEIAKNLTAGIEQDAVTALRIPENKSNEWNKGYKAGIGSVRARLTQAYKKYGIEELDNELNRTVNEMERR